MSEHVTIHQRALTAVCMILLVVTGILYAANSVVPNRKITHTPRSTPVTQTITDDETKLPKTPQKRQKKVKNITPTISLPLDLNSATVQQLCQIKGIGEVTARNIVAYRETHGSFVVLEDLMKVKGIGKKKFEEFSRFFIIRETQNEQEEKKEL